MKKAIYVFFIIFCFIISTSVVYASQVENVQVNAGYTNTLTFNLDSGDRVTGSISITGGSGNDINFKITNPSGTTIADYGRVSQGRSFDFQADQSGAYKLILDNSFSLFSSKSIAVTYDITAPTQPPLFGGNGNGNTADYNLLIIAIVVVLAIVAVAAIVLVNHSRNRPATQNYYPPPPPP